VITPAECSIGGMEFINAQLFYDIGYLYKIYKVENEVKYDIVYY
jgi:hypothetical protein